MDKVDGIHEQPDNPCMFLNQSDTPNGIHQQQLAEPFSLILDIDCQPA